MYACACGCVGHFALWAILQPWPVANWVVWVAYTAICLWFAILATGISGMAAGSGIPQMKTILSGTAAVP